MKKLHIKAIKKLAIGEVKPIEDKDYDNIVHVDLGPTTHHVSSNEHGEASATRNDQDGRSNETQGHSHEDGVNNKQVQSQLNNEERSEDNHLIDHDHDDEDDGPIQRSTQVPHPRVHQSIQRDHPIDNILGAFDEG